MALPPSKLAKVIADLPEDFAKAGKSIPNALKKQGVKDEELNFAELGLPAPNSTQGVEKWTKDMLKEAERKRKDSHSVTVKKGVHDTDYGAVNVINPTNEYEERIYNFKAPNYEFRSEHFPAEGKNYLAHTRVQPMDLNGKKVRTILEIQSDAAAANRTNTEKPGDTLLDLVKDDGLEDRVYDDIIREYSDDIGDEDIGDWLVSQSSDKLAEIENYVGLTKSKVALPYEDSMNRKLIERELFQAVEEGAEYTAIPIKGELTKNLHRSDVIQKEYETSIANTAAKIAKKQGLEVYTEQTSRRVSTEPIELAKRVLAGDNFDAHNALMKIQDTSPEATELAYWTKLYNRQVASKEQLQDVITKYEKVVESGGIIASGEYLVIKHPKGTKLDVNLYASPAATAGAAYLAYKAGYSQEEVEKQLVEAEGYTPEEAKDFAAKTKQALDAGYSEEEVKGFFDSQEVEEPELAEDIKPAPKPESIVRPVTAEQAAQMTHNTGYSETIQRAANATAFNAQELVSSQQVLNPVMASALQQTKAFVGYDNKTNAFVEEQRKTQRQQIANFAASKGVELQFDNREGQWKVMTPNGWQNADPTLWQEIANSKGEAIGTLAGAIGGAWAGQKAGTFLGAYGKAAGIIGGGAIGAVVGSEFDYIYQAMKHSQEMEWEAQQQRMLNAAQASLVYDAVGLAVMKTPGAVMQAVKGIKAVPAQVQAKIAGEASIDKAMADTMFLNKDESADLVRIMERFAEVPGNTDQEKRIAAAIYSQPGSEGIASAAARIDPLTSRAIAKTIDNRAQDLLKTANNLTDENLTRIVTQDIKNYQDDVKNFYTQVKLEAAKAPLASMYQFNPSKLAIEPVLESLKKNIDDPRTMEKFMLQMQRVQQYGLTRDFNDLLEMRKIVNGFKYNTKITSARDYERLNEVVKNIDAAVVDGANKVMPNPDAWLDSYKQANYQYAKMKSLEQNVLYKALTKPGIDYDKTVSALTRYVTADDSTFTDVVQKLPKSTRAKVEGSVINALAEKYTAGAPGGERAVYFPQLSDSLSKVTFTTPEARKFKQAVTEMGEVFRNDVPLAQVSGSLSAPGEVSLLTSDLYAATKRNIAQKIFNYGRRLMGDGPAKLIHKAADVLENPLNTKSLDELMKELDGAIDIQKDLKEFMSAAAQEQAEKGFIGAPKVLLYGQGKILGSKGPGVPTKVALHRIASIEEAMKVAEAEGISRADTVALDARLLDMGYKAIQYGADKARLLE